MVPRRRRRRSLHPLCAAESRPPPPTGTGCTCRPATVRRAGPLRERRLPQQQQHRSTLDTDGVSERRSHDTCATYSRRDRITTCGHESRYERTAHADPRAMHPVQPTAERTTACAAAEYLPADCGTAPVDVADVLSGHRGRSRAPPSPTSAGVHGVSDCDRSCRARRRTLLYFCYMIFRSVGRNREIVASASFAAARYCRVISSSSVIVISRDYTETRPRSICPRQE